MRSFRHWTPRYAAAKLRLLWNERRHPDWPWLTRDAVKLLDSLLCRDDVGAEFGAGRSTLWLARRCARLTSVESDRAWYQRVARMLEENAINNVGLLHRVEPEYVAVAEEMEDGSLDFALVDGIARDRCALALLPKLKPGGLMIIDNVNWYLPNRSHAPTSRRNDYETPVWAEVERRIASWRRIWTSNGVTDTLIAVRR